MSCEYSKLGTITNNVSAKYNPNLYINSQDPEQKPFSGVNQGCYSAETTGNMP